MAAADQKLRDELEATMAKVRHQIEVQEMSDHYVGSGRISADAIADLQVELQQLQDALAGLASKG